MTLCSFTIAAEGDQQLLVSLSRGGSPVPIYDGLGNVVQVPSVQAPNRSFQASAGTYTLTVDQDGETLYSGQIVLVLGSGRFAAASGTNPTFGPWSSSGVAPFDSAAQAPTGAYVATAALTTAAAGTSETLTYGTGASPLFDVQLSTTASPCVLTIPAPTNQPTAGTQSTIAAVMTVILRQPNGGGGAKVTWPSNVTAIGAIPALSTVAGGVDQFSLTWDNVNSVWVLAGTYGPTNSIDPASLGSCLSAVAVNQQAMLSGDTVASSGGTFTQLADRSGASTPSPITAATTTAMTIQATGGPMGGPLHGPKAVLNNPSGTPGVPTVTLPSSVSDFAIVFGFDPLTVPGDARAIELITTTTAWLINLKQSGTGAASYVDDNGTFTAFTAGLLGSTSNPQAYVRAPMVVTVAMGASSPHGTSYPTIRCNGVDCSITTVTNRIITGYKFANSGESGVGVKLLSSAYSFSTCPPALQLAQIERWVAGEMGVPITW